MAGFRGLFTKAFSAIAGAISHARGQGASVSDIVDSTVGTVPGATAETIGAVISATDAIQNSVDYIASLSPYDAITSSAVGVPEWAPPGTDAGGGGPYRIRIPYTNPGAKEGAISGWISYTVNSLPPTKAALMNEAQAALDDSISPKPNATLAYGTHILAF